MPTKNHNLSSLFKAGLVSWSFCDLVVAHCVTTIPATTAEVDRHAGMDVRDVE